jgi:hypothetical protein
MKTTIFAKCLAVVLAAGLSSFAGTAEAAIVSLDAPFDLGGNYESKFLNFDGTSLTASDTRGANSVFMQNIYGNLMFNNGINASNYAFDPGNSTFLTFDQGDVVSATSTGFTSAYGSTQPSSLAPHYYVVGFYDNQLVTSFPGPPNNNPDNTFIANSNLAWLEVLNLGGTMRVAAAGVNTVAGGSIAVGEYVAPSTSSVPEIDPSTGGSALSLVAGVLAMIEQRRRRRGLATGLTA